MTVQDNQPKRNNSLLSFLPKLFRQKSSKSKEIEQAVKPGGEIEISGSSEAEVIENMKLELTKLLHERNELKESLRNARSCPICSEMVSWKLKKKLKTFNSSTLEYDQQQNSNVLILYVFNVQFYGLTLKVILFSNTIL